MTGLFPRSSPARLKKLEKHGIIEQHFYEEHPPRTEFVLTNKGHELGLER